MAGERKGQRRQRIDGHGSGERSDPLHGKRKQGTVERTDPDGKAGALRGGFDRRGGRRGARTLRLHHRRHPGQGHDAGEPRRPQRQPDGGNPR